MLEMMSQPGAQAHLQRAIASGRLASTWIFAGPKGVGKFTFAVALAKTLLCDAPVRRANGSSIPMLPPEFELLLPCNACESCRAVESRNHPDLHIITKELIRYHDKTGKSKGTTMSIAVIRGEITGSNDPDNPVESKIYKRSFRGRGKWFIVDEADLMEPPAQNALLKTLEEPPPDSFLVLVTSSPQELLSTIRSRSQVVLFGELPDDTVVQGLIGSGMSQDDARLLARLSHGSLGKALSHAKDVQVIEQKNSQAAARAAKKSSDGDEAELASKFTPGGLLAWARNLSQILDKLIAGQAGGSDVAAMLTTYAGEYAALRLVADPLSSKDQATRDGLAILLGIVADYFDDRMRQWLSAPHAVTLPATTAGLDPAVVRRIIASTREAEAQLDMNANVNLLLGTTTAQWQAMLKRK